MRFSPVFLALLSLAVSVQASPYVLHEKRSHVPAGWTVSRRHDAGEHLPLRFGLRQSNMDPARRDAHGHRGPAVAELRRALDPGEGRDDVRAEQGERRRRAVVAPRRRSPRDEHEDCPRERVDPGERHGRARRAPPAHDVPRLHA